ncbi:MAG: acyl carrier protein [Clostridia bacterium]|nr:acyl carrier protein [Clostridia bacterium]
MKEIDVYNKIADIIKQCSEKKDITDLDDAKLGDVLDSLQFVKLIVSLEDEYEIEIPDKYLVPANLNSLSAMTQLVVGIIGGEK